MDNIANITGEPNRGNITTSLANLRQFSENINAFGTELDTVTKKKAITETMNNLLTASVSMREILAKIQSGEGMLGHMIYKKRNFLDLMFGMGGGDGKSSKPSEKDKKEQKK